MKADFSVTVTCSEEKGWHVETESHSYGTCGHVNQYLVILFGLWLYSRPRCEQSAGIVTSPGPLVIATLLADGRISRAVR